MRHVAHVYLPAPWQGDFLPPSDDKDHHLRRVLRMGVGDPISYTDGEGTLGSGVLTGDGVERGEEHAAIPPPELTLVVPPPAARERARFLVEKCAEIGVGRLLWTRTAHSEGRPPSEGKAWAWAVAALEQSRGAWLMRLGSTALSALDPADLIVADRDGASVAPRERATLLVGPEGGLDPGEVPPGAERFSVGPNVLRVETAALVASFAVLTQRRGS